MKNSVIIYIIENFRLKAQMIPQRIAEQYQELDIMLPVSQKSKNRLYLCWRNTNKVQCKMIGPQTKCFCNHRFKQHEYLNPQGKTPHCKAPKCKCNCFDYIPAHGANDFKCLCKHSYKEHDLVNRKCTRQKCNNCHGFASAWTCSCGSKFADHVTLIETYQERKAKGKTTNDLIRLNNQLNNGIDEGSLFKPHNHIKQDPQARIKMKRQSLGLMNYQNQPKFSSKYTYDEPQELQQYNLAPRSNNINRGRK